LVFLNVLANTLIYLESGLFYHLGHAWQIVINHGWIFLVVGVPAFWIFGWLEKRRPHVFAGLPGAGLLAYGASLLLAAVIPYAILRGRLQPFGTETRDAVLMGLP